MGVCYLFYILGGDLELTKSKIHENYREGKEYILKSFEFSILPGTSSQGFLEGRRKVN